MGAAYKNDIWLQWDEWDSVGYCIHSEFMFFHFVPFVPCWVHLMCTLIPVVIGKNHDIVVIARICADSVVTPGGMIGPWRYLDIADNKPNWRSTCGKNVCPGGFLKIFHWHLLGRSRKSQHCNLQNGNGMERKPQKTQTLNAKKF